MKKGRTARRRRLNSNSSKQKYLDGNDEFIVLKRWMSKNGLIFRKKLRLVDFASTGRGVMTEETVHSGDVIMEVPSTLILSMITLQNDNSFINIFSHLDNAENGGGAVKFACQELLAFYVSYLKIESSTSEWLKYVNTFPSKMDLPYHCNFALLEYLDERISEVINLQRMEIDDSYVKFSKLLEQCSEHSTSYVDIHKKFTLSLYEWAYFIVNSRCVFIEPKTVLSMQPIKSTKCSIFDYLSDDPCICLIPYLDMFNHSNEVETKTTISNPEHLKTSVIKKDSNQPDSPYFYFNLISLTKVQRFKQVFICYGNHCNLKLITHYGFCLPYNRFTTVSFNFSDICALIKNKNIAYTLEREKYKFIEKYNLKENIYIGENGYSFNFLRLLFIITSDKHYLWKSKIFSLDYDEIEKEKMVEVGSMILNHKKQCLIEKLGKAVENDLCNNILNSCLSLLNEYIKIIEKNLD